MKTGIFRSVAVMSAALVWLGIPAMIQAESTALKASIPFDFYVGATKLPSGVYTLWTESSSNSAIRLSDDKGHQSMALSIRSQNPGNKDKASLVFKEYEGAHFLAEVRWVGAVDAAVLPLSAMEIQVAKDIAARQVAVTNRGR